MIDNDLNIDKRFCSGCGACEAICPVNAISFCVDDRGLNYPEICKKTCINCNLCFKVCSRKEEINNIELPRTEDLKSDAYYGYSLNSSLRYRAATGGLVSQIAKSALDSDFVDLVVAADQNEDNEIVIKFLNSDDIEYIPNGSIYRQVVLLKDYISKIKELNANRILVIGLPCHIAAVKALHELSPRIKNRELYTVSLFCKQTKDERFSDFIRSYLKAKNKTDKIIYRGNGWPGTTMVDGKRTACTDFRFGFMWGTFCYTPDYCLKCRDCLGANADISIGDAWLKKYMTTDDQGSSLFLINSEKGHQLYNLVKFKILAKSESIENVIKSQNLKVIREKEQLSYRFINKKFPHKKEMLKSKTIAEFLYDNKISLFVPKIILKTFYRFVLAKLRS